MKKTCKARDSRRAASRIHSRACRPTLCPASTLPSELGRARDKRPRIVDALLSSSSTAGWDGRGGAAAAAAAPTSALDVTYRADTTHPLLPLQQQIPLCPPVRRLRWSTMCLRAKKKSGTTTSKMAKSCHLSFDSAVDRGVS